MTKHIVLSRITTAQPTLDQTDARGAHTCHPGVPRSPGVRSIQESHPHGVRREPSGPGAEGPSPTPAALTSSCLRASSCSRRSRAILCALSASAFRRSSCSFSFARFSKFALMLLVLLLTAGRRGSRLTSDATASPGLSPAPGDRGARPAGPTPSQRHRRLSRASCLVPLYPKHHYSLPPHTQEEKNNFP